MRAVLLLGTIMLISAQNCRTGAPDTQNDSKLGPILKREKAPLKGLTRNGKFSEVEYPPTKFSEEFEKMMDHLEQLEEMDDFVPFENEDQSNEASLNKEM